ncbi:response regulator transcription factor [Leptolyngbya sp. AN03gr2]|uniref:response regulator transcription factor n=1 Tax=unclassified Leptolyngbya TaxID=2650499 RepID=UPI003D3134CB
MLSATSPVLSPVPSPVLSSRELEVLHLLVEGLSNTEIAEVLHLSPFTVKGYIASIFFKLGVDGRVRAAVKAVRAGLV